VHLLDVLAALGGDLGLLLLLSKLGGLSLLGLGLSFRLSLLGSLGIGGLLLLLGSGLSSGSLLSLCGFLIGLSLLLGGGVGLSSSGSLLLLFLSNRLLGGRCLRLRGILGKRGGTLDLEGLGLHRVLGGIGLLEFKSLLGLHLLSYLKHLELGLGFTARQLVLSLQSGQVGSSSSLLGGGGLRFLDGLSREVLLLHALGFQLLGGLFFLEFLELISTGLGEEFFFHTLFLGHSDLALEVLGLLDFKLTLLLLEFELLNESLLLGLLLLLEFHEGCILGSDLTESFGCRGGAHKGHTLLMCLLGGFLESFLHSGELLGFAGTFRLLDGLDLDSEGLLSFHLCLELLL
jgi:hypothetical protein